VGPQFGEIELVVVGQEVGAGVERVVKMAGRIQLGAVAGLQNGSFLPAAMVEMGKPGARSLHRLTELVRSERQLLAKGDRCCGVIEADG
jgi:hypothetical protein